MVIFVYGDDTFRVQEKVTELRQAFLKKFDPSGINLSTYPSEPEGKLIAGEILQAATSLPFLAPRRFVVIRDLVANTKKDEEKVWKEGLSRVPETNIVVLWETLEPKALEKKALYKSLKEGADVHFYPFPQLSGAELTTWVAARVKERGGSIAPDALRELVARVGGDLWQMDGEIAKLIAFANGQSIARTMVEEMVRASFEGEIFALMDAVSQRRSAEAVKRLEQERAAGANDFYLLTMLARQVRLLLSARAVLDDNPRATKDVLASELGVHPFVASKLVSQASAFSMDQLRAAHEFLYQADVATKSGRMDAELAVDMTTARLLS